MAYDKILKIWAQSLGCPKNRVDTEKFLGALNSYEVLNNNLQFIENISDADLVFINTCSFIEPATRESISAILDGIYEKNNCSKKDYKPFLIVAGCLPGRYDLKDLSLELPEVDLWLPASKYTQWPELLIKALNLKVDSQNIGQSGINRILSTAPSYAYLKIAEGCNHKCAFCAIPSIRGPLRSDPLEDILTEAQELLEKGVKELILVAQDVTSWGLDLGKKDQNLAKLLYGLASLDNLKWLRLLYLYPNAISSGLLASIKEIGSPLLHYFDIPLQHSEKTILEGMGRPFEVNPREIVEKIRKFFPNAALRTTLITGYPGETEEQFKNLCKFVEESRFQNLGVFVYHAEEGTLAAKFPFQIPREIAEERKKIIMEIQANISAELLSEYVGQEMQVLVDKSRQDEWPGLFAGRVWFQAPEIDGITYISGESVKTGEMILSEITDSSTYDLSALAL